MGNRGNVHLVKDDLESSAVSENSKIVQIFELCLEPKTKEDLNNILLNFQETIKGIQYSEYFSTVDYVSIYTLDYIYKHSGPSFCAVSRTLYFYYLLDQLLSEGQDRSLSCDCGEECLLITLKELTNLHAESKEMLEKVGLSAILNGNLGLVLYLIKFRLLEFPSEINEKRKKVFDILVSMFNSCFNPVNENVQEDDWKTPVQLDELLNQLKEKQINIRRSILTFCILTIVAEYRMYEKLVHFEDLTVYAEHKKLMCLGKLVCIKVYIQATMELNLTFKDIENFTEEFLNPFLTAEVGKDLVETCKKLLDDSHNYYNPRSLKELARMKVRSMFRNTMSIPEQVNELEIPATLKEFLGYHGEGIWHVLVRNHLNLSIEQQLSNYSPEMENGNGQAIDDGNVLEMEDGNVLEMEGGNVLEMEGGNVLEMEGGNMLEIENGNML